MTTKGYRQLLRSAHCWIWLLAGMPLIAQNYMGPGRAPVPHLQSGGLTQGPQAPMPNRMDPHGAMPMQQNPGTHGGDSMNATTAPHMGVQFGPIGRWWDNKSMAKSVGLRPEQTRRMDMIFNENKPAILATYQNYLKEQSKLLSLSKNPQADKASTFAAIDAVNQARAALQKTTAQMYLQLRQQMDAAQVEKLRQFE